MVFRLVFLCLLLACIVPGCYSFRGGSVPADIKTVAIPTAGDQSSYGNATLRERITTLLIQKFTRDNSLQVVDKTSADAVLQTTILSVTSAPTAVGANQRATAQRLTVSAKTSFDDARKHKTLWEKSFSNYADYDPSLDSRARDIALEQALDKITDDILLEAVARW